MVSEWPMEPLVKNQYGPTGTKEKPSKKVSLSSLPPLTLEDRVRETLNSLKIRVQEERSKHVKSQLEKNSHNLQQQLREVERLARARDKHNNEILASESVGADGMASGEQARGLLVRSRLLLSPKNSRQLHEDCGIESPQICSTLKPGNSTARKVVINDTARLEAVSRLPSYTTWMFVDRNEQMTQDQSISRRRRISYETNGKETFFCLDDEEQAFIEKGQTKDPPALSELEEFMSRMTVLEHGSGRVVLETIADCLQVSAGKVESLFQSLPIAEMGNNSWKSAIIRSLIFSSAECQTPIGSNLQEGEDNDHDIEEGVREEEANVQTSDEESKMSTTLAVALDSFDTLFCRRCLVFNCALHAGLDEIVVGVNEIQPPSVTVEQDQPGKPCSNGCRFLVSSTLSRPPAAAPTTATVLICSLGSKFPCSSHRSRPTDMDQGYFPGDPQPSGQFRTMDKIRALDGNVGEEVQLDCNESGELDVTAREGLRNLREKKNKTQIKRKNRLKCKNAISVPETLTTLSEEGLVPGRRAAEEEDAESSSDSMIYKCTRQLPSIPNIRKRDVFPSILSTTNGEGGSTTIGSQTGANGTDEAVQPEEPHTEEAPSKWNRLEEDLCKKGIQIFGKNSCLIAQNILKGWKSCQEIFEYMCKQDIAAARGHESPSAPVSSKGGNQPRNTELLPTGGGGGRVFRSKVRFGRRKKVAPKFSLGAMKQRIGIDGGSGLLNFCRQFVPCSCESPSGCGKECPCVLRNMHCEKYCGCFKVCKNRFRGCQCAKSVCDRRNCPCFAAGRECDPDLCKFCWVDRLLSSSPSPSSAQQQCHNMRILQRKKKRLLLAQSEMCAGWGVFTKHPLLKNDYIGEYTGELISHGEADRRGRIYDRETSFLFNLNDELVVDAFRKGNKLKFANHSSRKPNCYAKVVLVGGDHRVGIFAKDSIQAGEELLYDYQYEPEIAPLWATGPG